MIDHQQMMIDRLARVRAELGGELAEHGENQHGAGVSDAKSSGQPDATYVVARLKRDRPDLAERVTDRGPNGGAP